MIKMFRILGADTKTWYKGTNREWSSSDGQFKLKIENRPSMEPALIRWLNLPLTIYPGWFETMNSHSSQFQSMATLATQVKGGTHSDGQNFWSGNSKSDCSPYCTKSGQAANSEAGENSWNGSSSNPIRSRCSQNLITDALDFKAWTLSVRREVEEHGQSARTVNSANKDPFESDGIRNELGTPADHR